MTPYGFNLELLRLQIAFYDRFQMLDRQQLHTRIVGSNQFVTYNGKTVMVSATATDQEIATALNLDKIDAVAQTSPVVVAKPIPASGSFTPGSLKALLQGIKDRQQAVMGSAVEKAKALNAALDQVEKMNSSMDATTNGILSEIGQFSNLGPD